MGAGAGGNFGNTKGSGKNISNPVVDSKRVGSARKSDPHHSFSDIIDNYVGNAKSFTLKGGDGKTRTLEEVGIIYGVTRERIRQIESKAIRKLRHPTRAKKLKDYWVK